MVGIIIIVISIAILIYSFFEEKKKKEQSANSRTYTHHSDIDEETHTVKGRPGQYNVTYTSTTRYLNGKPIKTTDEFNKWKVINNHAIDLRNHLIMLQNHFTSGNDLQAKQHYQEWKECYQKYRAIVVQHPLWNTYIESHELFTETPAQLAKEKAFLAKVEKKYKEAELDREIYISEQYDKHLLEQEMLNYLQNCPRKKCRKEEMIKALSAGDKDRRKALQRVYQSMKLRDIIGDKRDENGNLITRFIIHRKKAEDPDSLEIVLPASTYKPELYAKIYEDTVLKATLTVDPPQRLNRSKNTCQFIISTSGTVYYTSLEKCTCPAYNTKEPCKHMVKLAITLGYYHPENI